ncbi:uncharacterized protein B0I36DRAFT_129105 [Microdochium trichocladiopsis]|uniref:Uncharacterized protein n=1 Tax=Microdochium trichocladiopsis TaxID=1682393 RepID=A0A9P9BPE6_9PEZI|nr:uncharacterized protein B0I36DRAFT_129105 [Microdochium trichocladiopsis]KAH7029184.1 hypothetical protein B0I36DRAFT_129105 [Microdochium trichocladiopsis]
MRWQTAFFLNTMPSPCLRPVRGAADGVENAGNQSWVVGAVLLGSSRAGAGGSDGAAKLAQLPSFVAPPRSSHHFPMVRSWQTGTSAFLPAQATRTAGFAAGDCSITDSRIRTHSDTPPLPLHRWRRPSQLPSRLAPKATDSLVTGFTAVDSDQLVGAVP